eukprot:m.8553 g.8553  ORF g.8553 m.8553 type:complete len:900 (-) comp5371_c0_seq1:197-2896(-)
MQHSTTVMAMAFAAMLALACVSSVTASPIHKVSRREKSPYARVPQSDVGLVQELRTGCELAIQPEGYHSRQLIPIQDPSTKSLYATVAVAVLIVVVILVMRFTVLSGSSFRWNVYLFLGTSLLDLATDMLYTLLNFWDCEQMHIMVLSAFFIVLPFALAWLFCLAVLSGTTVNALAYRWAFVGERMAAMNQKITDEWVDEKKDLWRMALLTWGLYPIIPLIFGALWAILPLLTIPIEAFIPVFSLGFEYARPLLSFCFGPFWKYLVSLKNEKGSHGNSKFADEIGHNMFKVILFLIVVLLVGSLFLALTILILAVTCTISFLVVGIVAILWTVMVMLKLYVLFPWVWGAVETLTLFVTRGMACMDDSSWFQFTSSAGDVAGTRLENVAALFRTNANGKLEEGELYAFFMYGLMFEILTETIPQLCLQGYNNTNANARDADGRIIGGNLWNEFTIISYIVSVVVALEACYRLVYQACLHGLKNPAELFGVPEDSTAAIRRDAWKQKIDISREKRKAASKARQIVADTITAVEVKISQSSARIKQIDQDTRLLEPHLKAELQQLGTAAKQNKSDLGKEYRATLLNNPPANEMERMSRESAYRTSVAQLADKFEEDKQHAILAARTSRTELQKEKQHLMEQIQMLNGELKQLRQNRRQMIQQEEQRLSAGLEEAAEMDEFGFEENELFAELSATEQSEPQVLESAALGKNAKNESQPLPPPPPMDTKNEKPALSAPPPPAPPSSSPPAPAPAPAPEPAAAPPKPAPTPAQPSIERVPSTGSIIRGAPNRGDSSLVDSGTPLNINYGLLAAISRQEATECVQSQGEGCFVLRKKSRGDGVVMTVLKDGKTLNKLFETEVYLGQQVLVTDGFITAAHGCNSLAKLRAALRAEGLFEFVDEEVYD